MHIKEPFKGQLPKSGPQNLLSTPLLQPLLYPWLTPSCAGASTSAEWSRYMGICGATVSKWYPSPLHVIVQRRRQWTPTTIRAECFKTTILSTLLSLHNKRGKEKSCLSILWCIFVDKEAGALSSGSKAVQLRQWQGEVLTSGLRSISVLSLFLLFSCSPQTDGGQGWGSLGRSYQPQASTS